MYEYNAVVDKVVDGDTIYCTLDLGFHTFTKQKVRFARIDTPELSTEEGKIVKSIVEEMISGKSIIIRTEKQDKYGRWLGTIFINDIELNQWLLDNNYAKIYG